MEVLFKTTIPGRAGILKNSKQLCVNRKTGRRFMRSSERYQAFEKHAILHIRQVHIKSTIDFPVNLKAVFYFKDHQNEADLSNLYGGIEDILEDAGVLANDKLIYSHNGSAKRFGEGEPRCEIEITKYEALLP